MKFNLAFCAAAVLFASTNAVRLDQDQTDASEGFELNADINMPISVKLGQASFRNDGLTQSQPSQEVQVPEPVSQETAPVVEEVAPVVEETAPVVEETAPETDTTADVTVEE